MPSLYVLDVPEFAPLIAAAKRRDSGSVTGPIRGYYVIGGNGDFELRRSEVGLVEALWFAALTGGFEGGELVIDSERLRISANPGT